MLCGRRNNPLSAKPTVTLVCEVSVCKSSGYKSNHRISLQIFHDVAYKAKDRNDLVAGIDEFLDQVTVLPPGEWDPSIRIEPPKNVPSQVNQLHIRITVSVSFHDESPSAGKYLNICVPL